MKKPFFIVLKWLDIVRNRYAAAAPLRLRNVLKTYYLSVYQSYKSANWLDIVRNLICRRRTACLRNANIYLYVFVSTIYSN